MPYLIPLLMVALFAAIFATSYFLRERRKRDFIAAGAEFGFMSANPDSLNIAAVPLFDKHGLDILVALQGAAGGFEASLFDLSFRRGKAVIVQTVLAFSKPGANMPLFEVHARHFIDKFTSTFDGHVIKFPEDPNFANRFVVRGADPDQTQRFFTPDLQSFVQSLPDDAWAIEGYGDSLVLYRPGKRVGASALRQFVDEAGAIAQGFLALIPSATETFGAH